MPWAMVVGSSLAFCLLLDRKHYNLFVTQTGQASLTPTELLELANKRGWNHLLVSVDLDGSGNIDTTEKISYDDIGNPTSYCGATLSRPSLMKGILK